MFLKEKMRRYIGSILVALLTLPLFGQHQAEARAVLDKATTAFSKAGGVKVAFQLKAFNKGRTAGTSAGTIQLKGAKFLLQTPEATTWFDGQTQWSYLSQNDEVNVSTPTPEELQMINPYALLGLYRKGFAYQLGTVKVYQGTPVYEVILTATDGRQQFSRMVIYLTKETYRPVGIVVDIANNQRSEITVTEYRQGVKYADALFVFDKKHYPRAEIIDLR